MTLAETQIMMQAQLACEVAQGYCDLDDLDPSETFDLDESGLVWDTVVCERTARLTPSLAMEGSEP